MRVVGALWPPGLSTAGTFLRIQSDVFLDKSLSTAINAAATNILKIVTAGCGCSCGRPNSLNQLITWQSFNPMSNRALDELIYLAYLNK